MNESPPKGTQNSSSTKGKQQSPAPTMVDADVTHYDSAPLRSSTPSWFADFTEWMRGKTELLWEDRLSPSLQWLANIPARLSGGWVAIPHMSRHSRRRVKAKPFRSWNERGTRMLKQSTRLVTVVALVAAVVIILAAVSIRVASALSRVSTPSPSALLSLTPTPGSSITIRNGAGNYITPPPIPEYTMGMWVSNDTPGVGAATVVYARVGHNLAPVPNITVFITFNNHTISAVTNKDGIAQFSVSGNASQKPVYIYGSANVNGQDVKAETFFTPI